MPLSTWGRMGCSPPRRGRRLPPCLRPPISSSLSQSLNATTAMRSDVAHTPTVHILLTSSIKILPLTHCLSCHCIGH
jgi:hypothetical protein